MLKLATDEDSKLLFKWRNLSSAIELSLLQKTVSWSEHQSWFIGARKQNSILLFMIDGKAGYVRCDKQDNDVTISIYLSPPNRSKGLGIVSLNSAMREVYNKWQIHKFVAYIKEDNEASKKLFYKCGFVKVANEKGFHKMESL